MKKSIMCALAALAGSGVLTSALDAQAADCSTFTNPVYVAGSSASKPIWAALAPTLTGVTIVCYSVYSVESDTAIHHPHMWMSVPFVRSGASSSA